MLVDYEKAFEKQSNWPPLPGPAMPPSFPIECLPSPAREYVEGIAESIQVPLDMPAVFLLGAASTALLGKGIVKAKADHQEPLQLFFVVSAEPSERKSAALSAIFKPLWDFVKEENKGRAPLIEKGKQKHKMLEAQLQKAYKKGDMDEVDRLSEQTEEPIRPLELMATDVTPEALARAMGRNNGRMALVSGEGALFNVLAGSYSEEVNFDVILNGYSGEPVHVERVSREPIHIEESALAVTLAVQPVMVEKLLDNEMLVRRGLAARFLYAKPESRLGGRRYRDTKQVDIAIRSGYSARIQALAAYHLEGEPFELRPSKEAFVVYCDWFDEVERQIAPSGEWHGIAGGWEGKLCGNTLRIAGLLRMLDNPATVEPITEKHMRGAIEITRYFVAHIQAIIGCDGNLSLSAKEVLDEIIKRREREFNPHDLKQRLKDRKRFKDAVKVDVALHELCDAGYLRFVLPDEGISIGRPKGARYEVHPDIFKKEEVTLI